MDNRASQSDTLNRKNSEDGANGESEQELAPSSSNNVPELSSRERREVAKRARISTLVLHETVREEGERELSRPDGLAAASN